jgi:hypothetical protein
MAKLSVVATALCCACVLWTSSTFAQDLGGRATRPIERGPVDVAQLTRRADVIVHGVVTASRSAWIGRVIYTFYDVAVQDTVKGPARSSVTVAVVGGARGNVRLRVPGAPDLQTGEQAVFFLAPLQGTTLTPVGTFDGIVPVRQSNGRGGPTVAARGRPESLDRFLDDVRTLGGR